MAFNPEVNQEIKIFGDSFTIQAHPQVADIPYGQEGRQAIVYCLAKKGGQRSDQQMGLKVFKPRFQSQRLIKLARDLTPLAQISGLSVCHRTVLTMENSSDLLSKYPDLNNAMLMPWIQGPTWVDILLDKIEFNKTQSFKLAFSLGQTLAEMENMEIAHCDLSAANILLPAMVKENKAIQGTTGLVELVDVEQVYSRQLEKPDALPGGSPGYAHPEANVGIWNPVADRFAGALLIIEILAWCSPKVRNAAWGESFFDPDEMQKPSERYKIIKQELESQWGDQVSKIFTLAWESKTLTACPSFDEWRTIIETLDPTAVKAKVSEKPQVIVKPQISVSPIASPEKNETVPDHLLPEVKVLMQLAKKLVNQDNFSGALEAYQMVLENLPAGSGLTDSIKAKITGLNSLRSLNDNRPKADNVRQSASMRNYYMIQTEGNDRININKDLFIIGRSQSADKIIMTAGISRIHMEFIIIQNRIAARDLNSTNGTYINGRRIEPYALNFVNNGDRIRLANIEYEFKVS
ncbi:MAG: FHA domain-containing protein [Methanobacterium sp.]